MISFSVRCCKAAGADKWTVETWLTRWLDTTARPKISPTTFDRYEQLVRLHLIPRLGTTRGLSLRTQVRR
jgi:hypothetical protein